MRLSDYLREQAIMLGLEAQDKWDAIRQLADLFRNELQDSRHQVVLDAVVARERAASTGMENGIAIPHAKVSVIDEPLAAVGIVPKGVSFNAQDKRPAQIVVLLVIPIKSAHVHIRTLAAIAHMLNFEEMRKALVAAGSPEEALRLIKEAERRGA